MKKIIYYFCKVLNWIMILIVANCHSRLAESYSFYVGIGYILFVIFWFFWHDSRSRLTYQFFFFAGYIIGLYNIFTEHNTFFEDLIGTNGGSPAAGDKFVMVLLCVVAFSSKIVTMAMETKKYNEGSVSRHNNRLDDKVYSATYDLEHATNAADRQRAEARLERAKLDKERYYMDE